MSAEFELARVMISRLLEIFEVHVYGEALALRAVHRWLGALILIPPTRLDNMNERPFFMNERLFFRQV